MGSEVRLSVVEKCERLQVMSSPVCAAPESLPGDEMVVVVGGGWSSDRSERFGL